MTTNGTLKPVKGKWQFARSLMQTQTYYTPVILALKYLVRTFFVFTCNCKKKNLFLASFLFSFS